MVLERSPCKLPIVLLRGNGGPIGAMRWCCLIWTVDSRGCCFCIGVTGALACCVKNGVCAKRVENLTGFEIGCWFSFLKEFELWIDASELEDPSADPDAFTSEPQAFRLLKKEVLRAMPNKVGSRDGAAVFVGTLATVWRRLNGLAANLLRVSENEDFLQARDGRSGGSIVAFRSALSASSMVAVLSKRRDWF